LERSDGEEQPKPVEHGRQSKPEPGTVGGMAPQSLQNQRQQARDADEFSEGEAKCIIAQHVAGDVHRHARNCIAE